MLSLQASAAVVRTPSANPTITAAISVRIRSLLSPGHRPGGVHCQKGASQLRFGPPQTISCTGILPPDASFTSHAAAGGAAGLLEDREFDLPRRDELQERRGAFLSLAYPALDGRYDVSMLGDPLPVPSQRLGEGGI